MSVVATPIYIHVSVSNERENPLYSSESVSTEREEEEEAVVSIFHLRFSIFQFQVLNLSPSSFVFPFNLSCLVVQNLEIMKETNSEYLLKLLLILFLSVYKSGLILVTNY